MFDQKVQWKWKSFGKPTKLTKMQITFILPPHIPTGICSFDLFGCISVHCNYCMPIGFEILRKFSNFCENFRRFEENGKMVRLTCSFWWSEGLKFWENFRNFENYRNMVLLAMAWLFWLFEILKLWGNFRNFDKKTEVVFSRFHGFVLTLLTIFFCFQTIVMLQNGRRNRPLPRDE